MAKEPVARVMARYERWLSEQRLSAATRRSYRRWVVELATSPSLPNPSRTPPSEQEVALSSRLAARLLLRPGRHPQRTPAAQVGPQAVEQHRDDVLHGVWREEPVGHDPDHHEADP